MKTARNILLIATVAVVAVLATLVIQKNNSEVSLPVESAASTVSESAEGFVNLSDVCPDVILEVRYYSTYNFVGERIDGYEAPIVLVTKAAAEALENVSRDAKEAGYRLKVYDGYRPQMAVDHFVRWSKDKAKTEMKRAFYPDIDKSLLFEQGFISERSGHSRGSTVDVTLVEEATGREVDMGSSFDFFGSISHTNTKKNITARQRQNRKLLQSLMTQNGFRGISTEWWHFTLEKEPYPNTYFNFPVSSDFLQ